MGLLDWIARFSDLSPITTGESARIARLAGTCSSKTSAGDPGPLLSWYRTSGLRWHEHSLRVQLAARHAN